MAKGKSPEVTETKSTPTETATETTETKAAAGDALTLGDAAELEAARKRLEEYEQIHTEIVGERDARIVELEKKLEELARDGSLAELTAALAKAEADLNAITDQHNACVLELASIKAETEQLRASLAQVQPGKQLADEGEFEVVVVRRKKQARPTGRLVPKANIRLTVDDPEMRARLRKEGAGVNDEGTEQAHIVLLRPVPEGRDPVAYTVPEQTLRDLVARGVAVEELR